VAAAVQDALKLPEVQKRLADLSAEPMGLGPGETAAFMRQEIERWGAVIRTAGVKLECSRRSRSPPAIPPASVPRSPSRRHAIRESWSFASRCYSAPAK